jgi:hypothetical protein
LSFKAAFPLFFTRVRCRWIQPPAAVVENGIDAVLGYLRRIWGSASSLALDLSCTGATYFPPEVFEKRFSRLTDINLSQCDLQELPLGITMFTGLRSDATLKPFLES